MDRQFGDNNLKVSVIMNYDFGFPSLIIRGCVWFGGVFGVWGGGVGFFSLVILCLSLLLLLILFCIFWGKSLPCVCG